MHDELKPLVSMYHWKDKSAEHLFIDRANWRKRVERDAFLKKESNNKERIETIVAIPKNCFVKGVSWYLSS